jgi:6-phosphogluconolactonase
MRKHRSLILGITVLFLLGLSSSTRSFSAGTSPQEYFVYVGTYTGKKSKGIYACRLQTSSGALTPLGLVAETPNPTFLDIHPNGKLLYAANETDKFAGKSSGAVTAYSIDTHTGKLTRLNEQPSGGPGPCHVSVDKNGKVVLVANYGGGSIASYPIKRDGSLGEIATFIQHEGSSKNPQRQEGPHAHCIAAGPENHFVLAADLGLDQLLVYTIDTATGKLAPHDPPYASLAPGAGPRHFAFTPDSRYCYVINELNSTLTAFRYSDVSGTLKELQTVSTIPGPDPRNSTAEIDVHPSGKFVYGSNRGHDSIVVFAINPATGQLSLVQDQPSGGKVPRSFGIDPSGKFLLAANQSSDNVVVFQIDPATGRLTKTTQSVEIGAPVAVRFVPVR